MKKLFYLFMIALCAMMFTACSDDDKNLLNEEEEGGEGVITMVCESYYDFRICSFKEGEIITIDWGDGTIEEFKTVLHEEDDEEEYRIIDELHEYSNDNPHTITIKGNIKEFSSDGGIISLDVSKCTTLTYLEVYGCSFSSLDVSKCTKLKELHCWSNSDLTSLDVSKNTELTELGCYDNNLSSLDVSKNTKLKVLWCEGNELTSLDVSKNTVLIELDCAYNNLSSAALNKIFNDLPKGRDLTDEEYREYWKSHSTIRISGNPGTNTCDESIAEKKGWNVW